jgi:hypothetical protein
MIATGIYHSKFLHCRVHALKDGFHSNFLIVIVFYLILANNNNNNNKNNNNNNNNNTKLISINTDIFSCSFYYDTTEMNSIRIMQSRFYGRYF